MNIEQLAPQPMNGTDAALWEIERDPSLRTTVVSVMILDREIPIKRLINVLDATSRHVPRLRQRVQEPRLGLGVPHWVLADDFDVADHLAVVDVDTEDPAGQLQAVLDIAALAAMEPFDRTRPLWRCDYVGGLDPASGAGRAALIVKVHHSLADGVGGVALLDALFDSKRQTKYRSIVDLPHYVHADPVSRPVLPSAAALRSVAKLPARAVRTSLDTAIHPLRVAASAVAAGTSAARLLAPSGSVLSPLLTGRSEGRSLGVHDTDMDRLHDAAARHGCSINHLFFAGVLGGAAAYHAARDAELTELRVTMPVSFRRADSPTGGNQWGPVRFRVPADIADPVARMLAIRTITTRSRREPALAFTNTLAGAVQMLPGALSSSVVSAMMRGVDVVLTNVPGLSETRYLGGARVDKIYPFAPTAGAAFNVALLSHGPTACFGIITDTAAVDDSDELCRCIVAGIDEALSAAEVAEPTPAPDLALVDSVSAPSTAVDRPQRLSALDEAFLQLETANTPMHLGGLFMLDGDPLMDDFGDLRISDIRRHVEARLVRAPDYFKRLDDVPLRLGRPVWIEDPSFDITNHVRTMTLHAPGTAEQLLELVADINAERLERDRPLWELWFIDGLKNGGVAMLQKIHHALVDGVSSVELTSALFDAVPHADVDVPTPRVAPAPPSTVQALTDALLENLTDPLQLVQRAATSIVAAPGQAAVQTRAMIDGLLDLVGPEALRPSSPLNQPVGPVRQIASIELDFETIDTIRDAHGGSANDVALTVITGGLRTWLRDHHEPLTNVHAMCPVSTRGHDGDHHTGNQVGAMLIPLPLAEPDPVRRLDIIRERTNRAKRRHDGEGVARVMEAFDHLPTLGGGAIRSFMAHQPFVNLVITNVPGPPQRLWFLDAEIRSIVPVVPLGPNTVLGVALLSYDGVLRIGLHADPEHCPDLQVLADAVLDEFRHLADV